VVVAVLLSVTLMAVDHRYQQLQTLRSALAVVTYPLYLLADLPNTAGNWLSEAFATRNQLQSDNQRLHAENLELRAILQKHDTLEAENRRLRDLLGSSIKVGDRVLIAELSSVDLDPYKQQIVVNKGHAAGVYKGQAVVDAHGIMGQVTHTSPFTATVLLITDNSHAIPVQVLRSGLRTIAVGTGLSDQLDLPYLPNDADIQPGDLLVSSGLGGKFPPGYPVAEITAVQRLPEQPFAQVLARPSAHLDRSREVLLVWQVPEVNILMPDSPTDTTQPDASADEPAATAEERP
jgi:rod shape-determining protein MreC